MNVRMRSCRAAYDMLPSVHQRAVRIAINVAFGLKGRAGVYREINRSEGDFSEFKRSIMIRAFEEVGVSSPFKPHPLRYAKNGRTADAASVPDCGTVHLDR